MTKKNNDTLFGHLITPPAAREVAVQNLRVQEEITRFQHQLKCLSGIVEGLRTMRDAGSARQRVVTLDGYERSIQRDVSQIACSIRILNFLVMEFLNGPVPSDAVSVPDGVTGLHPPDDSGGNQS